MKLMISIAFTVLLATPAMAQVVFSPGLTYMQDKEELNGSTQVDTSETRADLRLGYVLPMGLYLGGMYSYQNIDYGSADSSGFLVGPSIGYNSMTGFYTMLTYHIMGEMGDTAKFTGAKGPQVDLGWVFPLTSSFAIGPQVTWRSIKYDKLETGGVSADTDYKDSSIAPYLSLWFMF